MQRSTQFKLFLFVFNLCYKLSLNIWLTFSYRNPKATVQRTNKKVNNDPTLRIQNLSILIRQVKGYYQVGLPSARPSALTGVTLR